MELKSILKNISRQLGMLEAGSGHLSAQALDETRERIQRENNMMVFGLPEYEDGYITVVDIVKAIDPNGRSVHNVVHAMRLASNSEIGHVHCLSYLIILLP